MSITDLDYDDIDWRTLGSCSGMISGSENQVDIFFDDYEADPFIAAAADAMCISCPVADQCGLAGISNKEWGVWGGIYLKDGKIDKVRNSHKTPETWETLKDIHDWL
jgi:hypothetical protein